MRNCQKQLLEKFIICMGLDEYVSKGVKVGIAGWFDLQCHREDRKAAIALELLRKLRLAGCVTGSAEA